MEFNIISLTIHSGDDGIKNVHIKLIIPQFQARTLTISQFQVRKRAILLFQMRKLIISLIGMLCLHLSVWGRICHVHPSKIICEGETITTLSEHFQNPIENW